MAKEASIVNRNMAFIVGVIFSAGVLVGNASLTTIRSVRNSKDIAIMKQDDAADDVRQNMLVEDVKWIRKYLLDWEPIDGQSTAKTEKEETQG